MELRYNYESSLFTEQDIKELTEKYNKAVKDNKEKFIFKVNGREVFLLTSYTKYLLEYIKGR